jgi:hypothetical protein
VPVSKGVMRSIWFPNKIARYAVDEELKAIRDGNIVVQRDFEFGAHQQPKREWKKPNAEDVQERSEPTRPKVDRITVCSNTFPRLQNHTNTTQSQRAMDLLGVLLPPRIDFIRAVHAESPDATDQAIPIFGSVSTADIVQEIRALLAHNDEAARITLDESDVKFVDAGMEDPTRAKHLGTFLVEILVKGSDGWPVSRKVHVIAQGE